MPPTLPKPNLSFRRSGGRGGVVGLDIQPGYIAAVQAHVNGGIVVQRAAGAPLAPDAVREGEVFDEAALGEALRELFSDGSLPRRVRIGLANQRTVLRTLELPPVTDRKELAAAVRFQAEDQVPMPLAGAVLDFHSLGTFDTPSGPRQRVIVVAAQREMVERLLRAVRSAGLRPEGVDLSAFALIRSLYRSAGEGQQPERVLYLNVGGLTNMAIAEGTLCRFTRVVGGGLEAMASEIAERRGIPLVDARALLATFDLSAPTVAPEPPPAPEVEDLAGDDLEPDVDLQAEVEFAVEPEDAVEPDVDAEADLPTQVEAAPAKPAPAEPSDADVRMVLQNGIREIVGEVRNSLDFHRAQEGGGEVASVVLSGTALELAGFAESLETELGIAVRRAAVRVADGESPCGVSAHRLAIATGLAAEEVQP
jgi:type IV pilus assembly protein PilM